MPFTIRPATPSQNDAPFIAATFDSTLPHLAATGNVGQWGVQPFSQKEGFLQSVRDDIETSRRYCETGEGEALRMFVAEVEDDGDGVDGSGSGVVSVAAMTIRDNDFAAHLKDLPELKPILQQASTQDFIFIDVLISDYRTGPKRKGSGLALLNHVKALASKEGKRTIYMDCFRGGTGRLIEYYEQQGFRVVGDFEFQQANGSTWPGRVLRLDLDGKGS